MWSDYFKIAFGTFKNSKKRTFLTVIGIIIGIAAVVSLISLGQGLQESVEEAFSTLGSDKIIIQAGTGSGFTPTTIMLNDKDLKSIKTTNGIDLAGGAVYTIAQVKFQDEIQYTWVIGLGQDESTEMMEESFSYKIIEGHKLNRDNEVYITHRIATEDVFKKAVEINNKIEIEGESFKVVARLDKIGNPQDDSQLVITLDKAVKLFNLEEEEYQFIIAKTQEGANIDRIAESIKKELRKNRGIEEGEEDFTVQTSEELMKSFGTILTVIQIVLIGIAFISLIVGGVGIMNTMYTSILERTNEIGILKAIGARNSNIFMIFLIESGILGIFGGVIGILIGISMSKLVAYAADLGGFGIIKASFPWYLIGGALLFSFVVGALAGTLPAIQASKLKPIDALRYE